jgi:hypothetical protein
MAKQMKTGGEDAKYLPKDETMPAQGPGENREGKGGRSVVDLPEDMKAMRSGEEAMPAGAEAISSGAEPLPAVDAKLIKSHGSWDLDRDMKAEKGSWK